MLQYQALNEYRALNYARKLRDMFMTNAQLVCQRDRRWEFESRLSYYGQKFRKKHHNEAGASLCAGGWGILAIDP